MSDEKSIRIAFIDDHDQLRNGICTLFGHFGFQTVFDAENGQVALDKMEKSEVVPDICVVDVNMPVMNGFETTQALTTKYPLLKILAFSVNDDEKDVIKMLECGANGYVLKGADPDELKNAIEIICNGGRYFSAGVKETAMAYFQNQ